jgi:23S rRNA (guanosine2251-2'-O)-methyltransferase
MAPAGIGDSLEGVHAVSAAVAAGRVRRMSVERQRLRHADLEELVATARRAGVQVDLVDDVRPQAATSAPQGVVARAKPIPLLSLNEAVDAGNPAAVLVLDHLEDPRNVGAIARSALAAGVRAMVVSGRRAAPLGPTAFKTAAGALEHVGVAVVSSVADAVARLRKRGLWIVGLDGTAERSLFGCDLLTDPVAVVVGAEGAGLSQLVADRLDAAVRIPLAPEVESLNASAAASLAVFEIARLRAGLD